MGPVTTDEVVWSVGPSVGHDCKPPGKAAAPTEMPFGMWT